jgi:Flp pilus assembly pilin Flp
MTHLTSIGSSIAGRAKDCAGAALSEYAILLAGVAVICFAAVTLLGIAVRTGLWDHAASI